jgi:ABC-2 type transport system permease protein
VSARNVAAVPVAAPRVARAGIGLAIAGHAARSTLRGALIWGVIFGLWVFSTIEAFVRGYPTRAERTQLAGSLQSFAPLLGLPHRADTVAGFTTWRILVAVAIIGAIWGLLTSTGLLRGEEEAGRWELLLAGPTTKRGATAQALLGLGVAQGAMFVVTVLLTLASTRLPGAHFSPAGCLLFALAMVAGAAMFLAVGAVASQVSATRGQAVTLASAGLGAAYLVRMIADSRNSLGWLRWLSPIGWIEELRPLQAPQLIALAPIVGLTLGCSALAIWLAGRRDLEASVLPESHLALGGGRWLWGPTTLAIRLTLPTGLAWLAGLTLAGVLYGSLVRSAGGILSGSPSITATLGRLGVRQAAQGYLGIVFFLVELVLAVLAASQIGAIRDEEASGRLDYLLVRPVGRLGWLAGRLGVSLGLLLLAGLTAGWFTWVGVASQHVYMAQRTLVEAGMNASVPAVFVLGIGTLGLGLRPRLSSTLAYAVVVWSFLIDLLGSLVQHADWLHDSSLFSHVKLAPAAKPDWPTAAIIVGLGLAAALLGAIAFLHRDIDYS